jgi:hypothetical protein
MVATNLLAEIFKALDHTPSNTPVQFDHSNSEKAS